MRHIETFRLDDEQRARLDRLARFCATNRTTVLRAFLDTPLLPVRDGSGRVVALTGAVRLPKDDASTPQEDDFDRTVDGVLRRLLVQQR
jgi:hypothetical protein